MQLFLDSADLLDLRSCLPHPLVHGVTTNPTLLRRAGVKRDKLPALLEQLLELGVRQVLAQVHSSDVDGMLADAQALLQPFDAGQLVVKIPATREGLRAGAQLSADGVPVTYTAVCTLEQVQFAAQLGAANAAPYLGRLQDEGFDGLALIARMQSLLVGRGAATRRLVASVRDREAFVALLQARVGAVTLPPCLFAEVLDPPATRAAQERFLADAGEH